MTMSMGTTTTMRTASTATIPRTSTKAGTTITMTTT